MAAFSIHRKFSLLAKHIKSSKTHLFFANTCNETSSHYSLSYALRKLFVHLCFAPMPALYKLSLSLFITLLIAWYYLVRVNSKVSEFSTIWHSIRKVKKFTVTWHLFLRLATFSKHANVYWRNKFRSIIKHEWSINTKLHDSQL